jgi:ParB family transcriptional regulator, chromosome partitioning protein
MSDKQVLSIPLDQLMPDPNQPRKEFLRDELERLAASIAARGVLMPLRVVHDAERECWRIVTGESRWRAARIAGLSAVPCLPIDGEISETDILSDQIIENTVRNDLRPMELARALGKLKALKKCNASQLAAELGISNAAITRAESLLSLPDSIQQMIDDGRIAPAAGYEISRLPDDESKLGLAQSVAAGGMNRNAVADAVQRRVGKKQVQPKASRLACKLDGFSVTVTAGEPLTWDDLLGVLDRIRKEAKKLCDNGKDVSALASVLRAG